MINFEEIAEKMEKVKQNYYKTNEKIQSKITDLKQQKENGDIAPNYYDQKVQANESLRSAEAEEAIEKLDKIYNKAEENLKSQVGFGDGDPAATTGILNSLDNLSKSERKVIATKWREQKNYIGLKSLRDKDLISTGDFQDIDQQKERLKKIYESKKQIFESKADYTSDLDRMQKISRSI